MSRKFLVRIVESAFAIALPAVLLFGQSNHPMPAAKPTVKTPAGDAATERAVIDKYCVTCHNAKVKTANLLLDQLDLNAPWRPRRDRRKGGPKTSRRDDAAVGNAAAG